MAEGEKKKRRARTRTTERKKNTEEVSSLGQLGPGHAAGGEKDRTDCC